MAIRKLWLLPLITFLFVPGSFFITYAIAVFNDHVDSFWPFISQTGTCPPESCIFGQLLNTGALLIGLCVYLRHRQIVEFYGHGCQREGRCWRKVSFVFMWIGFTSAFGASVVANFQVSNVRTVHMIGAMSTFFLGILYGWGQTIYSYLMKPSMSHNIISHVRIVAVAMATGFFISMLATGGLASSYYRAAISNGTKNFQPNESDWNQCSRRFHWSPDMEGYSDHIAGTMSEWLMGICFMLFILSFAVELRQAEIISPKLRLVGKMAEKALGERTPLNVNGLALGHPVGYSVPYANSDNPEIPPVLSAETIHQTVANSYPVM